MVGALFRTQISLVLASVVLPLTATLVYFLDLGPVPGFDWTPATFVVSGFALVAATLYFELFSLQPQAHSLLVSTMNDAVIATNASGRITLINPAGSALLGMPEDDAAGEPLGSLRPELQPLLQAGDFGGNCR
jgi:PAS domain-containing protein